LQKIDFHEKSDFAKKRVHFSGKPAKFQSSSPKNSVVFRKMFCFFTFSEKISISEYQPHGKELPLLPKNKIHCAGAVNPNLSGVVFLGFRCCFG